MFANKSGLSGCLKSLPIITRSLNTTAAGSALIHNHCSPLRSGHPAMKNADNFACTRCGKIFRRKAHCERHKKEHDPNQKHRCGFPGCTHSTAQQGNLNRHYDAVHEGKRPFPCEYCPSAFKQNHHLKAHKESKHLVELMMVEVMQVVHRLADPMFSADYYNPPKH
ncbi:hypothetical protein BOTBODRAFT_496617 [Botryobasidium botryosum FD-172 SS1]|uniref:C2H2-type domain-containing protein n=1 Tax=Botryobasidium botryosum (strain FD-172 SS1) TaxID=930990 RepID=A0A067MF66_BOTB1|nr:hypothetical protein BOTBODRAFT_496617 [Botryobasidium botryosum FD-172 SS1]